MTALRFHGVVLPGDVEYDVYVSEGRVSYEPVAGAETAVAHSWIVPGLIDAHCHVGLDEHGFAPADDHDAYRAHARIDRDAGVTTLRDCGSIHDTHWMADEPDLPEVIRAGSHIARDKRYVKGMYVHTEPADLPDEVERQALRGDGWVKIVGDWIDRGRGDLAPLWGLDELTAAMERAHAVGARVTAHTFSEEALPDLIASGIDCIEHGTGLTDDVIAAMLERGTALVPTVINIHNFPSFAAAGAKFPAYAAHMTALFEEHPARLREAYEAGVPMYAGTDAGGSIRHGRIADEVMALAGIGLSPLDALGAASWRAREWLGRDGLSEGARADFVCYDSNPLDDLSVLATPACVVLGGQVYSR